MQRQGRVLLNAAPLHAGLLRLDNGKDQLDQSIKAAILWYMRLGFRRWRKAKPIRDPHQLGQ